MEQTAQKALLYRYSQYSVLFCRCGAALLRRSFLLPENTPLVHIYVFADRSSFCRARVFYDNRCNLLDYRKNTIQRRSLKNVPQEHLHRFFFGRCFTGYARLC